MEREGRKPKTPQDTIEDCNHRLRLMDVEQQTLDARRKAITALRDRMVGEIGWDVT